MPRFKSLFTLFFTLTFIGCATPTSKVGTVSSHPSAVGVDVEKPKRHPKEFSGELKRLVIVGINDLHGRLLPETWKSKADGSQVKVGGAAMLSAYLNHTRDVFQDNVLFLDAGDMFQGTLISDHFKGRSVVDFYNYLGVTAAAIGNHEFDYGPDGVRHTVARRGEDPLGALKNRIKEAKFPIISSNIYWKRSKKQVKWTKPSTLVEIDGIKVGIIGLTTQETPFTTRPENVKALHFGDLKKATVRTAKALKKKGAKLILITAHAGAFCGTITKLGKNFDAKDPSVCVKGGEITDFARSLPRGLVHGIVAGHTHERISHFVKGIPIIESYKYSQAIGKISFFYNPESKKFDFKKTKIHEPVNLCHRVYVKSGDCSVKLPGRTGDTVPAMYLGKEMEEDPKVDGILSKYVEKVEELSNTVLAKSSIPLVKPARHKLQYGNKLGSIITSSLLKSVPNAQISVQNVGGIRADLPQGEITFQDLFNVLPFENYLEVVELKGSDLKDFIFFATNKKIRGFVFGGLNVQYGDKITTRDLNSDGKIEDWENSLLTKVTLSNGKPIDPNRTYRVVMNDFMGSGGEGISWLLKRKKNSTREILYGLQIRDSVQTHLESLKEIN